MIDIQLFSALSYVIEVLIDPLLLGVILLQAGDIATTQYALAHGGRELNKLVAKVMDRLGVMPGLLAIKLPLLGAVIWVWQDIGVLWQWFAFGVSAALVAWNPNQIRKARR